MRKVGICRAIRLLIAPLLLFASTIESRAAWPVLSEAEWRAAIRDARAFAARETPAGRLPFRTGAPRGRHVVVAMYLPVLPGSIDGKPAGQDYYARELLRPEGQNGKWRAAQGWLRERPMPTGDWPEGRFRQTSMAVEMLRAEAAGIDAFGVDMLQITPSQNWDTTLGMLDVAAGLGGRFRIIPEPDMATLSAHSMEEVAAALAIMYRHPGSYRDAQGRMPIIPFMAEARTAAWWSDLLGRLRGQGMKVAFIPNFLNPAREAEYRSISAGSGVWGGRDPTTAKGYAERLSSRRNTLRVATVSPQDARPRNFIAWEARNSETWRSQWEAAIWGGADIVHIVTWNDYSELTAAAPSSGSQFLFADLGAYYIEWLRRGSPPPILRDALYLVHRRQIFNPDRGGQPVWRMTGGTPLSNDVELVAMLTRPGRLTLVSGTRTTYAAAPAGLSTIRVGATAGSPAAALYRGKNAIMRLASPWMIAAEVDRQDPLYVGVSSYRPFIRVPGG